MTTDEVLQAVKEAGFGINHAEASAILFTRFAALVAAAEREACAKVCDELLSTDADWDSHHWNQATQRCAFVIRARSTP